MIIVPGSVPLRNQGNEDVIRAALDGCCGCEGGRESIGKWTKPQVEVRLLCGSYVGQDGRDPESESYHVTITGQGPYSHYVKAS